jgi:hypothetical protein
VGCNHRVLDVLLDQLASQVVMPKISVDHRASSGSASPHDRTLTKLRSNTSRVLGRAINRVQKFNILGGWCAGAGLS